ncbi:YraN family protein [Patescibacteria group bacterium]|nr:YraN family protein [Patescibacteria group bacterium]
MGEDINLGQAGEIVAGKLLVALGFSILERNFTCPLGEIDIIAQHPSARYFIEVKTRSGVSFGQPSEAVTINKQQRLRRLADYYIVTTNYQGPVDFGVVEVIYRPFDRCYRATLLDHAF